MSPVRAALTQTCNVWGPMPDSVDGIAGLEPRLEAIRSANVEHHVDLIERAHARGARIVGLGELFPAPYFALRRDALWREMAESAADGPTVTALRGVAERLGVVLVAPIYERAGTKRFNTAVVIDADGCVRGGYRKAHVPQGANEQGAFDELFYYGRADGRPVPGVPFQADNPFFPVFTTAVGRVGVATCYDRHFGGVIAALARNGAQLVFSPAVTFGEKSRRMWELEFPVDAARHNVFIGGSNRLGSEPPWNQPYFGGSYFVGPNGRLEDLSTDDRLVVSDVDLADLERPDPSGWNLVRDARPEIY
jgi:N-carbamoylputrescine amidase